MVSIASSIHDNHKRGPVGDFFQNKYGLTMEEFESYLHGERGREDFEKENDMDD